MITSSSPSQVPIAQATSTALPREFRRADWKMYAFEIKRRPSKINVGAPVQPRRVRVYAPSADAALAGAGVTKDEVCRPVPLRPPEGLVGRGSPQRAELADFYEAVGSALITGGGMGLALNMAARIARTPMMRGIIGTLHYHVMHGEDLHDAMRYFPRVFTPMQLAMVEAAGATGLDKAGGLLVTLALRLHKDGKIWRKFIGALAYPVSLILLTIVASVVLEIWALPPMVDLFRTLGGRLPPLTVAFYAIAQFIRMHAFVLTPAAALVAVAVVALGPSVLRSRFVQRCSIRLWLIGPIVQSLALVRALGTFILLKQSGAKVRDQFALAAAASGNCVISEFFDACYNRIALGESVEEAFTAERHRLGDDGVRIAGKMEIGMAGADLGALIRRIVDEISDRAEARLNLLPNALRWPLLIVCCAMIGTVALAIVLPYPSLIADVARQQAEAGAIR
jgi:type IV pilus assembly protein PilC